MCLYVIECLFVMNVGLVFMLPDVAATKATACKSSCRYPEYMYDIYGM